MIVRALALGAALVLVTGLSAQAQDDDDYEEEMVYEKESSAYMEVLFSNAYHHNNDKSNDHSVGGGVILGGHLTPWLAMEGQYEFHEYSKTSLASYQVKLVPFSTGPVQPFVKAGLGLMGGRPSHAFLFMGRFGLGSDVFLTEQVALTMTVSYAVAKHSNHVVIGSLGVAYYFE